MNTEKAALLPGEKIGVILGTIVAGLIYLAVIALVWTSFM